MQVSKIKISRYHQLLKDALKLQINALATIESNIDENFDCIIDLLSSCAGKIVVSGMGKSGYVARKFAATLSSTGTTSVFMHPSEALHGDLGMLASGDVLVLLSNSGNTEEIAFIIDYCHHHDIKVVGITRNAASKLSDRSDYTIVLENVPELTQIGAPTTSSTMMLVLCDLISLVLMEKKSFSKNDYKKLHPAGSIGNNLLTIKQVMHIGSEVPLVKEDQNFASAILEISQKRLGCVGVLDSKGALVGIVTDGDLRRHIDYNIHETSVREIMTKSPTCFSCDEYATNVLTMMNERKISNAFVMDGSKIIGIVHIHDLLAKLMS